MSKKFICPLPSIKYPKLKLPPEDNLPEPNSTQVEHPDYYNKNPSGVECLDVVRYFNFNLGNVIKYIWRAGLKDGSPTIQDLRKARFYLDDEIKKLEKETENEPQP